MIIMGNTYSCLLILHVCIPGIGNTMSYSCLLILHVCIPGTDLLSRDDNNSLDHTVNDFAYYAATEETTTYSIWRAVGGGIAGSLLLLAVICLLIVAIVCGLTKNCRKNVTNEQAQQLQLEEDENLRGHAQLVHHVQLELRSNEAYGCTTHQLTMEENVAYGQTAPQMSTRENIAYGHASPQITTENNVAYGQVESEYYSTVN